MSLTLLLGGARSGKSTLSVQIGQRFAGPVCFIATAEPFDDDLRQRVTRHRLERPDWPTIEEPVHLATAVSNAAADGLLIIDCLTVWVGNLYAHCPTLEARHDHYHRFIAACQQRAAPIVVVTNEVGMGVHPETKMGCDYRDELGRLNQMVAAIATTSLLLVAGQAIRLVDPWTLL